MALLLEDLADVGMREKAPERRTATKVLVSGAVRGDFDGLFAAVSKVNEKNGPFAAVLCVGDFFGDARTGTGTAPVPTYYLDSSKQERRRPPRGCEALGNSETSSGAREIGGLRVGFVAGARPDRDAVEALSLSAGAFVAGGGVDILVSDVAGEGFDALLPTEFPKAPPLPTSKLLGEALADLATQYHFVPADADWTSPGYRAGKGAPRVARLVCSPPRGAKRSLRAFNVVPHDAASWTVDLDTDEGIKRATAQATDLREATNNPYAATHGKHADVFAAQLPPPGLRNEEQQRMAAEQATAMPHLKVFSGGDDRVAATTVPGRADGGKALSGQQSDDLFEEARQRQEARLPVAFGGRAASSKGASSVANKATGLSFSEDADDDLGPSPSSSLPARRPREDDTDTSLNKRHSHHRNKRHRRMGAPDGPQF